MVCVWCVCVSGVSVIAAHLLSGADVSVDLLEDRFQSGVVANAHVLDLDLPVLGPALRHLGRTWGGGGGGMRGWGEGGGGGTDFLGDGFGGVLCGLIL